jgi:hypothetical protein
MHSCDKAACVSLQHLEKATQLVNLKDRDSKKRGKGHFTKGYDPRRVKP